MPALNIDIMCFSETFISIHKLRGHQNPEYQNPIRFFDLPEAYFEAVVMKHLVSGHS
jgi:hypothetical protein